MIGVNRIIQPSVVQRSLYCYSAAVIRFHDQDQSEGSILLKIKLFNFTYELTVQCSESNLLLFKLYHTVLYHIVHIIILKYLIL